MTAATTMEPPRSNETSDLDLGLNLIYNHPSTANSTTTAWCSGDENEFKKRPKRKNKYDRRREKGRLAKIAKLAKKDGNLSKNNGMNRPAAISESTSLSMETTSKIVATTETTLKSRIEQPSNGEEVENSENKKHVVSKESTRSEKRAANPPVPTAKSQAPIASMTSSSISASILSGETLSRKNRVR